MPTHSRAALTSAIAAVVLLLLAAPAQGATTVATWKMGGTGSTMTDSTGGHTGTLHHVDVDQPGLSGRAFGFSGTPSYVTVPASSDFAPGKGAFSIELSVRFDDRPSASVRDYDLLRMGLSSTSGGSWKIEILQNGKAYCEFRGSSGTGTVSAGPDLSDSHWHTLSCARTSSKVVLTVDGKSWSTSTATGSITSSQTVYFGARDSSGADQYRGLMDSVSISKG
jgi:hypothetical protein